MLATMPSGTMATLALKANPHLSWRRTARGGIYAMGAFVLAVIGFMLLRALGIGAAGSLFAKGQLALDDRIVLADFSVAQEDSALAPILAVAVRAAMSQSKSVRLMDQADVAQTLEQMQLESGKPLPPELAREVAERAGAKAVLGGHLARIGAGYAVSLELTSADRGVSLAAFQATADGARDLLPVVDRLTRDLRGKIGESLRQVQRSVPLEQATTSSLEALRKYSEASVANDVDGDYDRAVRLLREAVALDSTFALAWRKMAVAINNGSGSAETRDSALQKAFQYAGRLPDREKYLAIGVYYAHSRQAADRGKSLAAYQAAYAADTNGSIAANNLFTLYGERNEYDSAIRYSRRQLAIDRTAPAVSYLAGILTQAGRNDEATALLDSLHKVAPQADDFDGTQFARYVGHLARGQDDSLRMLLERLSASPSPSTRVMGLGLLEGMELTAGRLAQATAHDRERTALLAARGAQKSFDGLSEAFTDIYYRGRRAEGARALEAIVAGKQWSTASAADRPYLEVVRHFAVAGRPDRARELLARFEAESPQARAPSTGPERMALQGEIALAEGKFDESIRLFRGSNVAEDGAEISCTACTEFALGRAFDAAGDADSALAHFTAYLAIPITRRIQIDYLARAAVEKHLGELYDGRKNTPEALAHYGAFVSLWKGADPELQPAVAAVKRRMAELVAGEGK
jgi:tetratricopeptide (TPR) repeat protein